LERPGGLALNRVAQVRRDATVLSLELLDRVEGRAGQGGGRRVQSPASYEQQWEAGTSLLVMDADGAFFIEAHGSSSLCRLLRKHARRCGHRGRRGARGQNGASDRIHNRRPPRSSSSPLSASRSASEYVRGGGKTEKDAPRASGAAVSRNGTSGTDQAFAWSHQFSRVSTIRVAAKPKTPTAKKIILP